MYSLLPNSVVAMGLQLFEALQYILDGNGGDFVDSELALCMVECHAGF